MKNRTYRYFEGEALFPFGYGMSYTKFAYSGAAYKDGAVTVTVMNTGAHDADEVVQVYVKDLNTPFAVRNHSLCAFKRITLAAGASQTVTLPIAKQAFQTHQRGWTSGAGETVHPVCLAAASLMPSV